MRAGGQRGVAFLAVLLAVAALSGMLAAGGTLWAQARQREREQELLFVGQQYQDAIRRYYESTPGAGRYPPTLDALLFDPRFVAIRRHLRQPYRDPLAPMQPWGLIPAPDGGIMGVYSQASGAPIKRSNFPPRLGWSGEKSTYADWKFVFVPARP